MMDEGADTATILVPGTVQVNARRRLVLGYFGMAQSAQAIP